jgi:hypothetical protein
MVISGNPADAVAEDSHPKNGVGDVIRDDAATSFRVGLAGTTGSTRSQAVILVFQLPTLTSEQYINVASGNLNNLAFRFTGYTNAATDIGNLDVYGLGYRSASTVLASDYFSGALDENATRIHDNAVAGSGVAANTTINSSPAASVALGMFIQQQYDNGAVGGDYVFFRLNYDGANTVNSARGFNIVSADATSNVPTLTLDVAVIPEPSSAALLLGGAALAAGGLRRRRRG